MNRRALAMVLAWLCWWPGSLVLADQVPFGFAPFDRLREVERPSTMARGPERESKGKSKPQDKPKPSQRPLRVGILIYDGVLNTEFVAPLDVFQHAEARTKKVEVFTVAPRLGSVLTAEGLKVLPHRTFADAPNVDILVVPSGKNYEKDMHDPVLVAWIRERAGKAKIVHANSWGAFLLGAAGILDGRWATTFPPDTSRLQKAFPRAIVKADATLVDDPAEPSRPRVITSVGGVVSYDAALYIVEDLLGRELAERIAGGLVLDRTTAKAPLVRILRKP